MQIYDHPRSVAGFCLCFCAILFAASGFTGATSSRTTNAAATLAELGHWTIFASESTSGVLYATHCASASDCWAVGYDQNATSFQTLIKHWDGNSWTIGPSPSDGILGGVTCTSQSNCWAVGRTDTVTYQTLIEHWDGRSWMVVASPSTSAAEDNILSDITCISESDCWAVGRSTLPFLPANHTLIEHWDGSSWTIIPSPQPSELGDSYSLADVSCISGTDCWAVGQISSDGSQPLIIHWGGTSWSVASAPNFTGNAELDNVTCLSASDCWAVGSAEESNARHTLIEHWDGNSWINFVSPDVSTENYLTGITCASSANCWTVGWSKNGSVIETLIEHWDGASWSIATSENNSSTENYLHGIACASGSECWAVGDSVLPTGRQTLIEHWLAPLPPAAIGAVSRKVHGEAGTFDVDLPLDGSGIECRSGGASGDYQVVITFAAPVTVSDASATPGVGATGSVAGAPSINGYEVTVNLTNVSNAQTLTINLLGVSDGGNTGDISISMAVLAADTTGDGTVNSGDIAQTKSQAGTSLTSLNFRQDLNSDGAINSADISLVKSRSGTALP